MRFTKGEGIGFLRVKMIQSALTAISLISSDARLESASAIKLLNQRGVSRKTAHTFAHAALESASPIKLSNPRGVSCRPRTLFGSAI
jgi:hypothetical protein